MSSAFRQPSLSLFRSSLAGVMVAFGKLRWGLFLATGSHAGPPPSNHKSTVFKQTADHYSTRRAIHRDQQKLGESFNTVSRFMQLNEGLTPTLWQLPVRNSHAKAGLSQPRDTRTKQRKTIMEIHHLSKCPENLRNMYLSN